MNLFQKHKINESDIKKDTYMHMYAYMYVHAFRSNNTYAFIHISLYLFRIDNFIKILSLFYLVESAHVKLSLT